MTLAQATALDAALLELIRVTSTVLPDDVVRVIRSATGEEEAGSNARYALDVIGCNIDLAKDKSQPLCQDTGSILFFVHTPVGYDQLAFEEATIGAVREATARGYLRQNSVDSVTGGNTGDNIGPGSPNIHFHQWRRDYVEVKLMLKGGGCENVGDQFSLPHPKLGGRDMAGVENAILQAVLGAQGKGCGPGILGVAIGGDRASGYVESKTQLLRPLDDSNPDPLLAELEERIVTKANKSGIGPMGFGGKTTLLGCKIGKLNRLPASFYVSVSYMCWAYRRQGVDLAADGSILKWLY
ncbi:MAG: fumarate hydratase [Planctomycetota bacterium]|nr:MAG: fumarate hydratase [Planctomycetota bacterium]